MQYAIGRKEVVIIETKEVTACRGLAGASDVGGVYQFIFLALSGGFQDAYTYNCRDEVFSNAQTGNVVLMSQHFMEGRWQEASLSVAAFILCYGSFLAENVQYRFRNAKRFTGVREFFWLRLLFWHWWDLFPDIQYDSNDSCILCMCNAGTVVPQGGRLFLCQYYVYR